MFELVSSLLAHEPPYIIYLRCECGNEVSVDADNFETVKDNYVVLKKGVNVTCKKCGTSQPKDERFIPLEPQIIRNPPQAPESKLPFWMTRDITTEELLGAIIYD